MARGGFRSPSRSTEQTAICRRTGSFRPKLRPKQPRGLQEKRPQRWCTELAIPAVPLWVLSMDNFAATCRRGHRHLLGDRNQDGGSSVRPTNSSWARAPARDWCARAGPRIDTQMRFAPACATRRRREQRYLKRSSVSHQMRLPDAFYSWAARSGPHHRHEWRDSPLSFPLVAKRPRRILLLGRHLAGLSAG